MTNDRWYNPGDNYILDDLSGFKIRASRSRRIPGGQTGGAQVAPERWEPQQPQDFVRGVPDDQLPAIVRSRQQNRFVILATYVTAPSARLTYEITVDNSVGFSVGNNCLLMLDSGENATVAIGGIAGNEITLGTPLPYSVGTLYGDPIENTLLFYSAGPPINTGLANDNGVLVLVPPFGNFPTSAAGLTAGQVWCNGGGPFGVVAGGAGTGQTLVFGQITAGQLLAAGAGGVQSTPGAAGSGIIWNNGGELAIS